MNHATDMELAQLNIATLLAPIDSPALADFVADLERINTLAEQSPGFVWRSQTSLGNATAIEHVFGHDVITNLSVWQSIDDLHTYTYRSAHAQVMSKRANWFQRPAEASSVLWWVLPGHRPTLVEAGKRLQTLRSQGPGPDAFTFKKRFPSDQSSTLPG